MPRRVKGDEGDIDCTCGRYGGQRPGVLDFPEARNAWSLGREISPESQSAYKQPSPDVSLGWWSMGAQVGTALKKHTALAFLPHEGFLSPLLFGTIGKGRKLPFAGADARTLIIAGEGGDSCYAYMAELERGRQIATWGLDLTSGRPEATAILNGIISYLCEMQEGL